jgi:hypothetical protein
MSPFGMATGCEWNPKERRALYRNEPPHAEATLTVGILAIWHLCDSCAALPMFEFLKKRPLTSKATEGKS